jgi:hypothetical protein
MDRSCARWRWRIQRLEPEDISIIHHPKDTRRESSLILKSGEAKRNQRPYRSAFGEAGRSPAACLNLPLHLRPSSDLRRKASHNRMVTRNLGEIAIVGAAVDAVDNLVASPLTRSRVDDDLANSAMIGR